MSQRARRQVVRPSGILPLEVAELVERLVDTNSIATGPEAWRRYEDAKQEISNLCGPLAADRCCRPVFERALHAYMLGVCV